MTTTKLDLPDGGWAEVLDPEMLSERDRRPFLKSVDALITSSEDSYDGSLALYDHVMAFMVVSWSYGDGTFDPEAALDLPIGVYDKLRQRADRFLKAITPDFSVSPDEDSPTTPSDA